MKRWSFLAVALSLLASTAAAQSLVDAAKQEEARRKALKAAPAKVYTDEDLKKVPQPASPVPAPSTAPAADPGKNPPEAKPPQEPGTEKDETWWRNRITAARAKVERSKVLYDAMQSRINALTNDWSARDDPYQREQIGQERMRALGELQRLKDEIDAATKEIADIEEEARQAGVPPGWLR